MKDPETYKSIISRSDADPLPESSIIEGPFSEHGNATDDDSSLSMKAVISATANALPSHWIAEDDEDIKRDDLDTSAEDSDEEDSLVAASSNENSRTDDEQDFDEMDRDADSDINEDVSLVSEARYSPPKAVTTRSGRRIIPNKWYMTAKWCGYDNDSSEEHGPPRKRRRGGKTGR